MGVKQVVPDFSVMPRHRTRDNGHKLNYMKFQIKTMEFFTVRMTEHWNWLSGEAISNNSGNIPNVLDTILYNKL